MAPLWAFVAPKAIGTLSIADASEVVRQAAIVLSYDHGQGMVYRDIKPSNLMLDESGTVKILDFGLVLFERWDGPMQEQTTVGRMIDRMLSTDPNQRPPSAANVAEALADFSAALGLVPLLFAARTAMETKASPRDREQACALECFAMAERVESKPKLTLPKVSRGGRFQFWVRLVALALLGERQHQKYRRMGPLSRPLTCSRQWSQTTTGILQPAVRLRTAFFLSLRR